MDKNELRKVWGGVFDNSTIMSIFKLMQKGYIKELVKPVKEGKESLVLAGRNAKDTAIKVYAVRAANFKRMQPYLLGDPRFQKIKGDRRNIIFAWCRKEFKNLQRTTDAGVSCPSPITFLNNILVMEFIGDNFEPAPRLSDIILDKPLAENLFKNIIEDIKILYQKAKLVHGDLSEFNILLHENKPVLIDFSQAVLLEHPNADYFLKRDILNVCKYFSKYGIKTKDKEIYEEIVG